MDALNPTHSPENVTVWVTADRFDLRAGHAQEHVRGECLASPPGSELDNDHGAILACREALGHCARVGTADVKEGVPMATLQRDGNRYSEEAANSRGVKVPAFRSP